jgi:hypothetical protein
VRSDTALHLLEPGRAVITLAPRVVKDVGSISGVHRLQDQWYLGATRGTEFHLQRANDDQLESVATYPLYGRVATTLISSVHGDQLALWQRADGAGWHVYPLDGDTFEPGPPLHLPRELLSRVPPPCEPGRPGWVVAAGVPLTDSNVSESNTHIDFSGGAERLETKRLTARLILDDGLVCVDALAAIADGKIPEDLRLDVEPRSRGTLPLTVTNPLDDARWPFACRAQ